MALIWLKNIKPEKAYIERVHYMPEMLTEEQKEGGIEVPNDFQEQILSKIIVPKGKIPTIYTNPNTLEMWVELVDKPLTDDERLIEIEQIVADLLAQQMGV